MAKAKKRGSAVSRREAKRESVSQMMRLAQRHIAQAARLMAEAAALKVEQRRAKRRARRKPER